MKHIIVPIDFSKESTNGLRLAITFANHFKCDIQMVYVQKHPSDLTPGRFEEEHRNAEKMFEELVAEYSPKMLESANLTYIIKKGKIYREVVNQASAFEDSAIVCSTHGASGFEEFFIGSNAFRIISATDNPVITIRHGSMPRDIQKIVLPIDISTDTRQKVPVTAEIARAFNAEVHVIGVATLQTDEIDLKLNAYTKQVCNFLKERDIRFQTASLRGDNITDITIEYALDVNADLVSIMTEQNIALSDFVLGSYAQQMLSKSPIPVLSVTPKEVFVMGSFITQGGGY
ncbi:universal stress protein UspA [Tenuifilaceae bacterium CYCD]|nr:universal stress protein UspA [Tenuifilaceae bacterium CYCD]